MRLGVLGALCLALLGNLLVPAHVLVYNPCCYNEFGELMPMVVEQSSEPTISEPDCCQPRTVVLRDAPVPTQELIPASDRVHEVDGIALLPEAPAWVVVAASSIVHRHAETGPPNLAPDLLKLHSRLNL